MCPGRFASGLESVGTVATVSDVKRGFWAHQFVEYLLGIGAIATGANSPKPALPCIAGALMVLNGASTEGPLSAFKLVPLKLHRFADFGLIGLMLIGAVAAGPAIDPQGRAVLFALAFILGFVTWRTSFVKRVKEPKTPMTREEMGRLAGHVSGNAYKAVRKQGRAVGEVVGKAASSATADGANAAGRLSAGAVNALRNRKRK